MLNRIVVSILVIVIALFASKFQKLFSVSLLRSNVQQVPSVNMSTTSARSLFDTSKPKTPVYFFSHGGPSFMYEDDPYGDTGAYKTVSKVGKFIKKQMKPNFIIVVSAHWEGNGQIEVSVPQDVFGEDSENELIYDFYGFPQHMYKEQFHSKGNVALSKDIKTSLKEHGLKAQLTPRGLDHGVWVPFKVAFSTNKEQGEYWDVEVPLVQVSLQHTNDFTIHRQLGQALEKYRELGGLVICSGMSVHNLRDLGLAASQGRALPYVTPFNKLLTSVVSKTGDERFQGLENLKIEHKQLLFKAHPTLEHFMPVVVASGAAEDEQAKELYNSASLSLGWGVYQFGEYKTSNI
jgi:aromatic ring-opening dioxygenase catalytic subunit (LigB family)